MFDETGKLNLGKLGVVGTAALVLIIGLFSLGSLIEINDEGYYKINQGSISGEISIRNEAGPYLQAFDKVTTYTLSNMLYFSKSDADGGGGEESAPIKVRFNDGGTALISGGIRFKLSLKEESQRLLHKDYKSHKAVESDLVRQVVTEALMQTATLMKAEESYSTRRSEFTALAEEQIKNGIYETISNEKIGKDAEGNEFIIRTVSVKRDKNGVPVVRKQSSFKRYNIEITQFVIKEIDFDKTIDNLIAKKKEAEQAKVVAKAKAEKAKQDAITSYEQGKARVAQAKADEEVEKIKAVTQAKKDKEVAELAAQKQFEVAKLERKEAEERAKAAEVKGRADALVNKLKVSAGLTPQEKAEWSYKTRVGVAEQLAKIKLPELYVGGGSGKGGQVDPFTALGIESLMKINNKMSTSK